MKSHLRTWSAVLTFTSSAAFSVAVAASSEAPLVLHGKATSADQNLFQILYQLPTSVEPALGKRRATLACERLTNKRLSESAAVQEAMLVREHKGSAPWCRVTIKITVPSSTDVITVWMALPIDHWNGRFLGLGGGGWVAGFPAALLEGVRLGFATAVTNAGRAYDLSADSAELARLSADNQFLLDENKRLDWTRLENFAYRGIHEMTVAGKVLTNEFYGVSSKYAYFSGCSTGGRQGQAEVQRYPDDYDGVLSGSPAINWAHFVASESWQGAVTNKYRLVPQCKFDAAYHAAVDACDSADGVRDGLVSTLTTCHYDAHRLIGQATDCGNFEQPDADVVEMIWNGPTRRDGSSIWNGVDRSAVIHPLFVPPTRSPFDDAKLAHVDPLSVQDFELAFDEFVERYGGVMDTSNSDLRPFAARRGKTIIWHGISDDVIPAAGTLHYVQSVKRAVGERETESFLRLYLAPGVQHCGGGTGPLPEALMQSLISWVEEGKSPTALRSEKRSKEGSMIRARPLCPYPEYAHYEGDGSINDVKNFRCKN